MFYCTSSRLSSLAVLFSLGLCAVLPVSAMAADKPAEPLAAAAPNPAPPPVAVPPAPIALPAVAGSYDVRYIDAVEKVAKEAVVIVSKRGEAFKVDYQDSEGKYSGIAFLQGNVLGVAYADASKPSLYLLEPDGTGWRGRYIDSGDSFLSKEEWKRR
ncbi:MAG: hypothetical protein H7836_13465 [Magnetococcus sp. YQC-3]